MTARDREMKPSIVWDTSTGSEGDIRLGDKTIGRVYHEGIAWTWRVGATRSGGYANIAQLVNHAVKAYRHFQAIREIRK